MTILSIDLLYSPQTFAKPEAKINFFALWFMLRKLAKRYNKVSKGMKKQLPLLDFETIRIYEEVLNKSKKETMVLHNAFNVEKHSFLIKHCLKSISAINTSIDSLLPMLRSTYYLTLDESGMNAEQLKAHQEDLAPFADIWDYEPPVEDLKEMFNYKRQLRAECR